MNIKGRKKIGLGNGHKKSKEYKDFVLKEREFLRNELKFCERAVQKVLLYSNNFLHRRLKTEDRTWRVERVRGKSALGLLKTIEEMASEHCCDDQCVLLAKTHAFLLTKWRERATSSQAEARKVLAEMLTPSGGRSNCFNFITMVTGSSARTIGRVKEQMRETGGDREPPPHGLKKYWEKNPYKRHTKIAPIPVEVTSSSSSSSSSRPTQVLDTVNAADILCTPKEMTQEELRQQQSQLEKMQAHLEQKKVRIQQQQQLIEEQLHKNKLAEQQRQKQKEQRQAQMVRTAQAEASQTEIRFAQQLFTEIQGQLLDQHLQQQLLVSQTNGQTAAQAIQNAAVLSASHPPPSYNVAVALNSSNPAAQQGTSNQAPPALVFQTSHVSVVQQAQLQNLLLGNTSVNSNSLLGTPIQQHPSQHNTLSSANQQILVSLAQNLNTLSHDLNGEVVLSDQNSSDTSHNPLNVMSPEESVVQHLTRSSLHGTSDSQSKAHRVHSLVGEPSNHEIAILVPGNTNNNGSHSDTGVRVESLLSSDALQIFGGTNQNIILQSIPVSIAMPLTSSS